MSNYSTWQQLIDVFLAKNGELNLSAIRDADGVFVKHIQDSLELLKIIQIPDDVLVVDVGTGGGFPLLPLAMSCPKVQFTGIDARRKKVVAINDMLDVLHISNAQAVWVRVEDYALAKADIVTARAVAHVDVLLPWILQVVRKWGKIVLYKEHKEDEKKALDILCKQKKLTIEKEHHYVLFDWDIQRVIYILQS
jgi:16S rRNA (guanine527-N7)-methyltransferase